MGVTLIGPAVLAVDELIQAAARQHNRFCCRSQNHLDSAEPDQKKVAESGPANKTDRESLHANKDIGEM